MKFACVAAFASFLFVGLTGSAVAADSATQKPIVVSDKVTVKATVETIDHTNRIVGAKPGGGVTDTTVSTVTILAIDPATPAVTIRTSDGAVQNVRVMHPKCLREITVGDVVVVTKKKALMISVE